MATERTTRLRELNNEYVFVVDRRAGKYQIRKAVIEAFKVKVDSVRTMIIPGKSRRMGRFEGKTPSWKKAIVRLKKGEVITIFENV
jgi:large subunit ribosomal protein L23